MKRVLPLINYSLKIRSQKSEQLFSEVEFEPLGYVEIFFITIL